jgi:hypothetical protein
MARRRDGALSTPFDPARRLDGDRSTRRDGARRRARDRFDAAVFSF